MLRRILLGVGHSAHTQTATAHAIELAAEHGASITALATIDVDRLSIVGPVPIGGGAAADELRQHRLQTARERASSLLGPLGQQCRAAEVACQAMQAEGDPAEVLIGASRYHDLVVVGMRHAFELGVQGEMHFNPIDLMVPMIRAGVRPILAAPEEHRPIQRVLIAYGGSMEAARTMRHFAQLRLWTDASIHLVTFGERTAESEKLLTDATTYLRAHDYGVVSHFGPGPAKRQLLEEAHRLDADVIVMGNSGRRLILEKIFGETVSEILNHSDRAVFLSQ